MATFRKVNKTVARQLFGDGFSIYLLPSKIGVYALADSEFWCQPAIIGMEKDKSEFDRKVNEFEYYNCNSEVGYYAHYYVKEE